MSCQVEQIADCGDISTLARALFIHDKEDENWLSQCCVSVSPCGNVLAVGHSSRLCLLTAQWISSTDSNTYLISWNGTLPSQLSTILALSICPSHNSSQNGPDWYCIVVGFKNGLVGFYTNTGHLLLSEKFEEQPVIKISCHTGTYGTLPDDICVLYDTCICVISGATLFQTLRLAKAQVARVQAGALEDYTLDSRSLSIKKWGLTEHEVLNDACVVGLEVKNTYDHLLAASSYGGYDTWYRSIPPANTLVLSVGAQPYVAWQYALEGGTAPPLQEVARAVANKIKSKLPGWLGGGNPAPAEAERAARAAAASLSLRCGVRERGREARGAALCPERRLVAVTDALGRVALLDLASGNFVRMFKGCRDAQCAFVQVFEDDSRKPKLSNIKKNRRALFLIIYNPKKGVIDIRLMRRGNRVAAFTATKNGRLLHNTCGLVGAEPTYTHNTLNLPQLQCLLIDPDGKLKKINIPFFYALEGEHSDRSKDLHILRNLRDYLKRTPKQEYQIDDILSKAIELRTLDLKKHCIEMLIRNHHAPPSIVIPCLSFFIYDLDYIPDTGKQIKNYVQKLVLVTWFFSEMNNEKYDNLDKISSKVRKDLGIEDMQEVTSAELDFSLLMDDDCVMERMLLLAQENNYREHQHARVTFSDDQSNSYKEFVSSFDLESNEPRLMLKADHSQDKLASLAAYIFKTLLEMKNTPRVTKIIRYANIDPKEIIKLMIQHIMSMSLEDMSVGLIERLIKVLYFVCLSCEEACRVAYNEESLWWEEVRRAAAAAACPLRGMLAAMAGRAAAALLEPQPPPDWEALTADAAKWAMLIGRLEDIAILSIVLHLKETFNGNTLPKLVPTDFEVNLNMIYTKGKGSVTELISKWLCSMGVPPAAVLANQLLDAQATEPAAAADGDAANDIFLEDNRALVDTNPRIFKWVSLLRQQFPFSTSADYIIVNMCWEYALDWQKNVQDLEKLSAAADCLKCVCDKRMRLGLCTLVWSTYIKPKFEHSCRLVNKVGKLPKEPLCLQDVGMSDTKLINFLEIVNSYLERYVHYAEADINAKTKLPFEKIWDNSSQSLMELAQDSCEVNEDVLFVLYQMSCVVYYQCYFNMKVSKPLSSLFEEDLQAVLEGVCVPGVGAGVLGGGGGGGGRAEARARFVARLSREAAAAVTGDGTHQPLDMTTCMRWVSNARALAAAWAIDEYTVDEHLVIALFLSNHEQEALGFASGLPGAAAARALPALLAAAAGRLRAALSDGDELPERLAALPPALPRLLDSMEPSSSLQGSLAGAAALLNVVLSRLEDASPPSPHAQHAALILQGCDILRNMGVEQ